jgi:hypothetical protein
MALPLLISICCSRGIRGESCVICYISIGIPITQKVSISISFIESGFVISTRKEQSVKQPLAEVM